MVGLLWQAGGVVGLGEQGTQKRQAPELEEDPGLIGGEMHVKTRAGEGGKKREKEGPNGTRENKKHKACRPGLAMTSGKR